MQRKLVTLLNCQVIMLCVCALNPCASLSLSVNNNVAENIFGAPHMVETNKKGLMLQSVFFDIHKQRLMNL